MIEKSIKAMWLFMVGIMAVEVASELKTTSFPTQNVPTIITDDACPALCGTGGPSQDFWTQNLSIEDLDRCSKPLIFMLDGLPTSQSRCQMGLPFYVLASLRR